MTKCFPAVWRSNRLLVSCLLGSLGAALLAFSAPAAAQDAPAEAAANDSSDDDRPFARDGLYFGMGGNASLAHGEGRASGISEQTKGGFIGRVGRRFHPHVAAEAQIEFAQAGLTTATDTGRTVKVVGTANLRVPILTGRIQPFLLAGLGIVKNSTDFDTAGTVTDEYGAVLRLGGGVEAYLTRSIALTVDASYVQPTGSLSDTQYVSIAGGVLFRF